ncbi:MAG TPA: phospholipase D-like domain-containing protein [Longimicrobiaceae bacterium]|nr:phospholipase D-like domain-containing protein [Longimicrobiaceae bacterium]
MHLPWSRKKKPAELRGDAKHADGHIPRWIAFFAALGVIAAVGVVVSLFSHYGRQPDRMFATARPGLETEEFVDALAGSVGAPVESGGRAQLQNNGVAFFPSLIAEIDRAKHSVDFMVYIWEPGKATDQVLGAMTAAAKRGVQVRLMLDGVGGNKMPEEGLERFVAAGGRVITFNAFTWGKITRFYKRNHRRAIVIDGLIGYTGGQAVSDKWIGNAQNPERWHDSMVRVTGPMAISLQQVFAQSWAATVGEVLAGPAFYPDSVEAVRPGEVIAKHVNVVSSPGNDNHPLRNVFWLTFASARHKLYIATPYFVPDQATRRIAAERARAGVDVRIMVPATDKTDAKPIAWAGQGYYEDLLEAGVKIYEYQPTMMHAKTVVADGIWSIVGSANMDVRSDELNQENVLGIQDAGFAAQIEQSFMADLQKSKQLNLAEFRQRGTLVRLREKAAQLFENQY